VPRCKTQVSKRLGRVAACVALVVSIVAGSGSARAQGARGAGPFGGFDLPPAWQERFWARAGAKAILALDERALADLVPAQAGLRFCRCPHCEAEEADDPLGWDPGTPDVLTCRRCGKVAWERESAGGNRGSADKKDDKGQPKDDDKGKDKPKEKPKESDESVEVLPRLIHHYPYVAVEPERQHYPDERLYLAAKRDYEVREFLSKAALYAAVKYHHQTSAGKDPRLARLAAVIMLRFAQVYPAYATHYDQPGRPKIFQPANLPPPYRRGYQTAKWDWNGSLDVPLNLVIAYALLRDDPALAAAGRLLNDPHPALTIERDLVRASAQFVRAQPEEYNEMSLQTYRGMLAAGQLLGDRALIDEVRNRLTVFAERGFYHDGFWRQGDVLAHRRVLGMIDGWIVRLLAGQGGASFAAGPPALSIVGLAKAADAAILTDPRMPEIQQTAWPAPAARTISRRPMLLGGVGVARLAVGDGPSAFDVELHGQDSFAAPHFQRLSVRIAVGGRPVLDDLDEFPPVANGWDRATASHNTVVVDGLNQRESLAAAVEPTPGGQFRFFAADPDFQVVTLEDPSAYPQSTTLYRQTMVVSARGRVRYAVGIFEVRGGLQHDQVFHAAAGSPGRWLTSARLAPGPASLLPPSIVHLPLAKAEEGRWFVQFFGEFTPLGSCRFTQPGSAWLRGPDGRGLGLHFLGSMPTTAITAITTDPTLPAGQETRDGQGRAALVLRRRSDDGSTLHSTFVTVYEPLERVPLIRRVSRAETKGNVVLLTVETVDGVEHVAVNLKAGSEQDITLSDGRSLRTDGLVVRVAGDQVVLAGGTFAQTERATVQQAAAGGRIVAAVRQITRNSRGWFETDGPIADVETLAGRTILIRHGDGTTRGWTIDRVENSANVARVYVVEEPGFQVDARSREARYYQFPRTTAAGPHDFRVPKIAR
jgi:hypothetical protein